MLVNHGKYNINNSELGSIDRPMIRASHFNPPADFQESSKSTRKCSDHPSIFLIYFKLN